MPDKRARIRPSGTYVSLDLSGCAMSGTEFDPGAANTGEPYITDLTLPNTAASVKAGDYLNPTFRYFTALKSVTGDYIVSVHKVCYFADRPCIFSPNGCENAVFKEVCP